MDMKIRKDPIYFTAKVEEEMFHAVKLFQVGAVPKTIARYTGMTHLQALSFIQMARNGVVKYLLDGEMKTIQVNSIPCEDYITRDIESEWTNEDIYGGKQGKMPEYKVLWENEMTIKEYREMTIKEYKQLKAQQNGKDEKLVH